jgi:hypothetical protein
METPKAFLLRMPPSLYRDLQHYKIDAGIPSFNDLCIKALDEWLRRRS